MPKKYVKTIVGIIFVTVLLCAQIVLNSLNRPVEHISVVIKEPVVHSATLLAFGDVNLGRTVGQRILKNDVHFPFRRYFIKNDSADIVFANLECQVSFQNGETGHPKFNLIFTAPPEAVTTLKNSGIDIVSTANNHALDYGIDALLETIDRMNEANIPFVGTSKEEENLFKPLIIEKNNIKFAIFGVTSFVNMTFKNWRKYVATPDTVELIKELKLVRDSVDVVILSYHGGVEYIDRPIKKVMDFADWSVAHGVDIFLGHHPHVTFGIKKTEGKYIVHSLGNFIFYQPHHYWTQRGYGLKFSIVKRDSATTINIERFLPIDVSTQTQKLTDSSEIQKLFQRTQLLSNIDLTPFWN